MSLVPSSSGGHDANDLTYATRDTPTTRPRLFGEVSPRGNSMFLFFSNRLGCLGSIVVSALITAVILLVVFGL